ncbi:MAG TPA: methyltransferase domain-containing protein [Clostridia bacterium]|nr:methyltransferase domain-containing protein [Clostridia bacterium]
MERRLEPELLDELPVNDPGAVRSRKDLRRVNAWMGNARILTRTLKHHFPKRLPDKIVELGAGDGVFLLRVAQQLNGRAQNTVAVLIDRQDLVVPETRGAFNALGWKVESINADAIDWLKQSTTSGYDVMLANLFLHHLDAPRLRQLLREATKRTSLFVALEPRRSGVALLFSRLVGLIGCNYITRHDAKVSVRAGFRDKELSNLWPERNSWFLQERPAGPFSHLFVARRLSHAEVSPR